jgi:ribosomal protein S18 acetylase RimI-like enzyme
MAVMNYHVKIIDPTNEEERNFLFERLMEFNLPYLGKNQERKVVLGVDDEADQRIAGLAATITYDTMYIERLWVDENVRSSGIGRKLMLQAERIAKHSGCRMIHLFTYDFQAPDFYERLGFEQWGVLEGFPNGHRQLHYRKLLNSSE